MSYTATGQSNSCSGETKLYKGECLTVEEQDKIGPALCRPNEHWVVSPQRGCKCTVGFSRNKKTGACDPSQGVTLATVAVVAVVVGVAAWVFGR